MPPLTVTQKQDQEHDDMSVKLQQRTYSNDNGRAVPEGDPSAVNLVGPAGKQISLGEAERLGLKKDGSIKSASKPQDKAVKGPPNDKGAGKAQKSGGDS